MTSATGAGAVMSLNVSGGGATCDDPAKPTACTVPNSATFTLAVVANDPPDAGYVAFQSQVFYGGLAYQPAASAASEIVWPGAQLPARAPEPPAGSEGLVAHGALSASGPPFPSSNHSGNLVALSLRCSAQQATFTVALLPYSPQRLLGAGYRSASNGGIGPTVPAKVAGQAALDLDGDPDTSPTTVDVAGSVQVTCGQPAPTNTPTRTATATATATPSATATSPAAATATRTPTRTATRTPTTGGVAGDVDCNGTTTSIDAALELQNGAGLLASLRCPQNADVNRDRLVTSVDAALILQFVAGLINHLPV